ncbi:rod-binding protein [Limnobacter sp.]|uniref:rod-binding protein n=1 Tax=Limnobacter sp. TaxID=2003368 RepID=UPI0025857354|nr:rod-binding protein [Limnobacter sp.]
MVNPLGINPGNVSGSIDSSFDSRALNNLKNETKAQKGSKEFNDAIDKASVQFESVFLQWALKSMRQATPDGGLLGDNTSKQYQAMFDQQIVQSISGKGLGLAGEIARQLRQETGAPTAHAPLTPFDQASTLRKFSR